MPPMVCMAFNAYGLVSLVMLLGLCALCGVQVKHIGLVSPCGWFKCVSSLAQCPLRRSRPAQGRQRKDDASGKEGTVRMTWIMRPMFCMGLTV